MANLLTLGGMATGSILKGVGSMFKGLGSTVFKNTKEFGNAMKQAAKVEGAAAKASEASNVLKRTAADMASYGRQTGESFGKQILSDNTVLGKITNFTARRSQEFRSFKRANPRLNQAVSFTGKAIGKIITAPSVLWTTTPGRWASGIGAVGAGAAYGGASASINRYRERKQRGMTSNHLGTDGLTLALSKTRHR